MPRFALLEEAIDDFIGKQDLGTRAKTDKDVSLLRTRERTNYNLRSSSQLLLQPYNVTKTKKTLGDRAFQVASPGLWNSLPNDIRNAKTMDVFKSLVKTYLFRKAYACYF